MRAYLPVIETSGLSDIGSVREENQDAIHISNTDKPPTQGLLFAIADGMGGYTNGGVASALALKSMSETLLGTKTPSAKTLRQGIENANLSVYKTAQQLGSGRMGTTLTAAYIMGKTLYLAHVGDSRAYLVRNHQAICLTRDHTQAGELAQARLISPDKVRAHTQRSVLTRAIGLAMFVQPDVKQVTLQTGDWLILCSDGVWSVIEDDEFASFTKRAKEASELGERLIRLALERGTDDNVSVVVVHVHRFEVIETEPERVHTQHSSGWLSRFLSGR